ncbi:hydroxymyristoyl-ACP dehydratase [Salinisphaera sp. LB1]|uniref:hydroxymyristoyl-ACP dehydratase n=1 Tax=Salinisphaera sp. LB1 TaxID=2183911 RepID=UPI000FEF5ACD|nr:hydroxymyristoyl-ACP dehydratase [Salinisphaera sp. LB1]
MADHVFSVAADHPCLDGHFPGAPIVPGVVLLDHVGRAAERRYGGRMRRILRCKFVAALYPEQRCVVALTAKTGDRLQFACTGPAGCVAHGVIEWSAPIDG